MGESRWWKVSLVYGFTVSEFVPSLEAPNLKGSLILNPCVLTAVGTLPLNQNYLI
jgi:hypothetical protein